MNDFEKSLRKLEEQQRLLDASAEQKVAIAEEGELPEQPDPIETAKNEQLNQDAKSPNLKTKDELEASKPNKPKQKDDMLAELKANLEAYKAKINAPKKELDWRERLPDIMAGAHNILNYSQGTPQKNIATDFGDKREARQAASRKEDLSGLQNLQKMYQDYITAQNKNKPAKMTPYQSKMVEIAETKNKLAKKKSKVVEPTFKEKEVLKAEAKDSVALKKENRKERRAAEQSNKSIDEQIANMKKAKQLMQNAKKNKLFDTGPIDQYAAKMTDSGQALEQAINAVSLDKMVKMFAGMSKAIDSDAERAFFQSAQPSMGKYPEVNLKILDDMIKNMESLKRKNKDFMGSISPAGIKKEAPQQNAYSNQQEAGIEHVMKNNNVSREAAINALRKAGKL